MFVVTSLVNTLLSAATTLRSAVYASSNFSKSITKNKLGYSGSAQTEEMVTSSSAGGEQLSESVEELRERLKAMKRMMERERENDESGKRKNPSCKESVIDASFLSFVFLVVLLLIVGVSIHAFQNLYFAIVKKFSVREHTEL